MKRLLPLLLCSFTLSVLAQSSIQPGSTRAGVTSLFASLTPRLEYRTDRPAESMERWRDSMSVAMAEIMHHPSAAAAAEELIESTQQDGYRQERWRSWPLAEYPVEYLVLVPDSQMECRAAALCIPGFGQTKELLASPGGMARLYAQDGIVAVAVDNPSFGQLNDCGYNDYLATSRLLLEMEWSYLGLSSWQDRVILEAMKRHSDINAKRIIVSGFSLGTEPLMVLGLLDRSIYAFVYNDFLCRTRERILVMDAPAANGLRPLPNSIEHLIPGFLTRFDFPDICAALSPRPLICTEGGLDRDFRMIADAYTKSGATDGFSYFHYPKYADSADRALIDCDTMPSGIDRDTYFRLANVDPPSHGFKAGLVLPWIRKILGYSRPSM